MRRVGSGPLVMILGCCRQDSIYWTYKVTNLRNGLGYTHYPLEAIEVLRVLTGIDDLYPEARFRNALIGLPIADVSALREEFEKSNIVIVEVASRLRYRDIQGRAYHHVAYDSPPSFLALPDIFVSESTDRELESELQEIRRMVAPRPMIVVSHLVTRSQGRRAELRDVTSGICHRMNVPFVDLLEGISPDHVGDLVQDEPVIAHLTPKGHQMASRRYQTAIDRCHQDFAIDKLVQVFPPPEAHDKYHGFGDFLQGAAFIYEYSKRAGLEVEVSLSGTSLEKFVTNTFPLSTLDLNKLNRTYHEDALPVARGITPVFTNKRLKSTWRPETRQWIRQRCLAPNPDFRDYIQNRLNELGLESGKFEVVHIRLGDQHMAEGSSTDWLAAERLLSGIAKSISVKGLPQVVMSDSPAIFDFDFGPETITAESSQGHIGRDPTNADVALDSLTDFFILGNSARIHTYSVYPWVSGFAKSASDVWSIPLVSHEVHQ